MIKKYVLIRVMVPLFFGLGLFSADAALTFHSHEGGWESSGYLSQMHWGYLLALYAYLRYEEKPVYGWTT